MYVSVICTISDLNRLEVVKRSLNALNFGDHNYEFIFAIDNRLIPNKTVLDMFIEATRDKTFDMRNIDIFNTRKEPPSKFSMNKRRNRIAAVHSQIRDHIGGSQLVFCFEDDTLLEPDSLLQLIETWKNNNNLPLGMVTGVQAGRWGKPHLGLWHVDDCSNPNRFETLLPSSKDAVEPTVIAGSGLYCFITLTQLYRQHEFNWSEPVGPDVHFGLSLCKNGFVNLVDWRVNCGHVVDKSIIQPDIVTSSVIFTFNGSKWEHKYKEVQSEITR